LTPCDGGGHNRNVAAVMVESRSRVKVAINVSRRSTWCLKEICDQHHWLFISDECSAGWAHREWFVYQHAGFSSRTWCRSRRAWLGVPVGACVVGGRATGFSSRQPWLDLGGNPLHDRGRDHHRRPSRKTGCWPCCAVARRSARLAEALGRGTAWRRSAAWPDDRSRARAALRRAGEKRRSTPLW